MIEMQEVEQIATRREAAASNPADSGSSPDFLPQPCGAVYVNGVLQPGCTICGDTIPERTARFRSKVCSNGCRYELRKRRDGKLPLGTLYCQVCRGEIPPVTAKKLGVVCDTKCRNEMRRYRFLVLKSGKCPTCLHPSTPAEWEEYRCWRLTKGRDTQAFMRQSHGLTVRKALRGALTVLQNELAVVVKSYATEWMEGQPVASSLSPDGEAIATPLRKAITEAEAALKPQKTIVDTGDTA